MATNMRGSARRGVLLLIILALLALFGVVAVGFVIISGQQRRSAEAMRRVGEQTDWPEKDLNEAALQVLRGTENPQSVIGPHSLLEDVYGTATVTGYMQNAGTSVVQLVPGTGEQLINFTAHLTTAGMTTPSRFVGCVLTMLQGVAAGKSTRIIGYGNNMLQVVAFDGVPSSAVVSDAAAQRNFVINAPAFSGTGFGFYPAATPVPPAYARSTYADSNEVPFALRPNPAAPTVYFGALGLPYRLEARDYLDGTVLAGDDGTIGTGDDIALNPAARLAANEDYDAVDYQNMLLAMIQANGNVPIPSLHRPELINYWFNLMETAPTAVGLSNWPAMWSSQQKWQAILNPAANAPDANTRERLTEFRRKIILRPLRDDHPNFTGSNPDSVNIPAIPGPQNFWECLGPWDVDNNGDGVADSIWVDLGAPVRTRADGRLYKPLFAILCLDLDGRLNLNAHGCLAQTNNDTFKGYTANIDLTTYVNNGDHARGYYYAPHTASNIPFWFGGNTQTAAIRRGQGYGPAEINLLPLFANNPVGTNYAEYRALLTGNANAPGRYDTTDVPGASGQDYLSQNKLFEYWNEALRNAAFGLNPPADWRFGYWKFLYPNSGYMLNVFGTPANFRGDGAVALDLAGQPIYCRMGEDEHITDGNAAGTDQNVDTPYEFNLAKPSASNAKFSTTELERILRPFDSDSSSLPDRILRLVNHQDTTTGLPSLLVNHRHDITTESWDIPVPAMMLTPTLRQQFTTTYNGLGTLRPNLRDALLPATAVTAGNQPVVPTLVDLLIVRLAAGMRGSPIPDGDIPNHIATMLPRLLPLDLLSGRKMDINRPFGNGTDNNGNRVVDEPAGLVRQSTPNEHLFQIDTTYPEEISSELVPQINGTGTALTNIPFNHCDGIDVNGDGLVNNVDRALARQLYARQLYVMALLLMNYQPNTPINNDDRILTRQVAQWAVNVVDFRDRDSIMTPFEYDIDPFRDNSTTRDGNTWDVDGVIDSAAGNPNSDDNQNYRGLVWGCERPELLITETLAFHDRRTEDLNTDSSGHTTTDTPPDNDFDQQKRPEGSLFIELFNPSTRLEPKTGEFYSGVNGGVDLARMVGQSPVWRLTIDLDATAARDPDSQATVPERSVYFVHANNIDITANSDGRRHYPRTLPNVAIEPGRYAVIGPGRDPEEPDPATTTYIGLRSGHPAGDGDTRRIVLNPAGTPPVAVRDNTNDDPAVNDLPNGRVQPPVAVVVDSAFVNNAERYMRLSVSELVDGYPAVDEQGTAYDKANRRYVNPFDTPLDTDPILAQNGTHSRYRVVHLQRLANPLLPWNEFSNPYRTVDSMPIDLTIFNGVEDETSAPNANLGAHHFFSRERGESAANAHAADANVRDRNPWTQSQLNGGIADDPARTNGLGADIPDIAHVFRDTLHHTLGYLSHDLTDAAGPRDNANGQFYVGDPLGTPFPWLTWNNRPYISQLELLQVPATSARELLMNQEDLEADVANHWATKGFRMPNTGAADNVYETFNWPFGHLMNLFLSRPAGGGVPDDDINGDGNDEVIDPYASLHQLLDMLYVPSRFVGTELQGNPQQLAAASGHLCYPPFHQLSLYREPGRINLNTAFSATVLTGLYNEQALTNPPAFRNDFMQSLRGNFGGNDYDDINNQSPTRLESPFRSAIGTYLVPQLQGANQLPATNAREITPTLLRADNTGNAPLLLLNPSTNAFNHTDRNSYFRYQELQRLGNLTTTRSNVYAVWVTVGYFEVEPRPARTHGDGSTWTVEQYKAVYPDGYALGAELGSDTGDVQRHRAFYIFDRSIPVGFQRGYDLNTGNCVRLKRFIE
jgi:hypothetical protein